jgi:hypothetical protein
MDQEDLVLIQNNEDVQSVNEIELKKLKCISSHLFIYNVNDVNLKDITLKHFKLNINEKQFQMY